MNLHKLTRLVCGGVMAGAAIGIAATIYLRVGGVVGAALFAFGLIMVVAMKLPLFTGQAQHVCGRRTQPYLLLGLILLLNLLGCALLSALTSTPEMVEAAGNIIEARLQAGPWRCFLLSIPCGMIMTLAVRSAALRRNWLPLLFGVPGFIICGFPHCVADSFYYASCGREFISFYGWELLWVYLPTVAGNWLGCNLYRLTLGMPAWFKAVADDEAPATTSTADGSAPAPTAEENLPAE